MTRATAARHDSTTVKDRHVEALRLLAEAAADLLVATDADTLLERLLPRVRDFLAADACLHYLQVPATGGGDELQLQWCSGVEPALRERLARLAPGEAVCGVAARERVPQFVDDVQVADRPDAVPLRPLGVHAYACFPLLVQGRLLGTLGFGSRRVGFDAHDRDVMATLARYLAFAWERLDVQRRLAEALREREALLDAERAARMEADRAARMKDEFLATISHELRTPLNAILGWARLLKRPDLDARAVAEGVEVIERNARMQAQLITDLLDVNRIVSGKLTLELDALRPVDVVRAALQAAAPAMAEKRLAVRTQFDAELPEVAGDAARLQQVVGNLLTNAIKFTPAGGGIDVGVRRAANGVEIVVRDSGEGIDPEILTSIFDRFRQGDASTGRRHGGLGLGLAIVRQLVQMHGGSVEAASEGRGRGATFTVRLPARGGATADLEATGRWRFEPPEAAVRRLEGLRVLLVDDQADALEFLRRVLVEHGARPITATSTAEALQRLVAAPAGERPELLVSDIGMPGENGYELIRQVRALPHGGPERLPAIALTAFAREADQQAALAHGFQAHVAKPVQMHELLAAILRWRPHPVAA